MIDKKEKQIDRYHNQGGKEKTKEYYQANKDAIRKKARTRYQNLSEEQKEFKKQYSRDRYKALVEEANKVKEISSICANI